LACSIYTATRDQGFQKDYGLRDQIRRAGVSVMANIAEGFERGGRSEFHQFLVMAKASCAEVRSHLYVASDAGYLEEGAFNALKSKAEEVASIIGGLRASVQRQRDNVK
jgi:four helix bundle protein